MVWRVESEAAEHLDARMRAGMRRVDVAQPSRTSFSRRWPSYWIYLVNRPLVIGAQIVVGDWGLPSGIKVLLIPVGVSMAPLVSYQVFVRDTPIGTLLNGRKRRAVYG